MNEPRAGNAAVPSRSARSLPPICFLVANAKLIAGRVRFPDDQPGKTLQMDDGQRFTIFRHAHLVRPGPQHPAIFIARFRFRRFSEKTNRRLSLIPVPLIVGFPGFADKLWMSNPETGFWQGVYQFESVAAVEAYQRSFVLGLMNRRAEPGTLSTWTIPDMSLELFVANHLAL